MAHAPLPLYRRGFGETLRRDAWWLYPLTTFVILGGFLVYATWAAFQNAHYTFGPYLSPFYAPEIFGDSPHAWFGPKPGWWPALILIFLGILFATVGAGRYAIDHRLAHGRRDDRDQADAAAAR